MKEITENTKLSEYEFEGIVVSIPKIDLYANAEFYVYGMHINIVNDRVYNMIPYNMEDGMINGFGTSYNIQFEDIFKDFEHYRYYQFENMKEFCEWYIHKDDKLKESIKDFKCKIKEFEEQNNPILKHYKYGDGSENNLYSPDEIRNKINPGWNTRREKLADVLKLLELRDLRQNTIDMLVENITPEKRCYLEKQLERDDKRIEDFLSEEV